MKKISIIRYFILDSFLYSLSFMIPKGKNMFLFGSSSGKEMKYDPKYLYLYLIKNNQNKIKFYWVTSNKNKYKELKDKEMPVLYKYSVGGFFKILRGTYFIFSNTPKDITYSGNVNGNFNYIQTWHGTPLKKVGNDAFKESKGNAKPKDFGIKFLGKVHNKLRRKRMEKQSLMIAPSKEVKKKFSKAFLTKNIEITGNPRNDVLFKKDMLFNNPAKKLALKDYEKVFLYAPTFRDDYDKVKPFSKETLENLNRYLKKNNFLLIIKKHPAEKEIVIPERFSNIKNISEEVEDVQEILLFIDVLITDYSSIMFDFALTDKPIIFYPHDYREYLKNCKGMYYDYFSELPGPFANNEKELLKLIKEKEKWFNKKDYKITFLNFKKKFHKYIDGNSCKRFFKTLSQMENGK